MVEPELRGVPVLVTGGAGFIGSHLVDALVGLGARVTVLDNFSTGRRENLRDSRSGIELVEGDIRDLDVCRRATAGAQFVFHQAALGSVPRSIADPAPTLAVNVQGTCHVLTAAHESGAKRIILASSSSVFGDSRRLPKKEGEEGAPLSPYAASKQMTEGLAEMFGRCYGLEWIALRYFNIYGPRQDPRGPYAAVIPRFFHAALRGEPMIVYGDGEQSRDFTHVRDVVRANLLSASAGGEACGRAYNVAAGNATAINELARSVAELCDSPYSVLYEAPRPGDVRHAQADLGRIRSALGYRCKTDLREGLASCVEYYRGLFPAGSHRTASQEG